MNITPQKADIYAAVITLACYADLRLLGVDSIHEVARLLK